MVISFLDFQLDEERFELRSRGALIPTQARVFSFSVFLLRHRERVVSKDELIDALWDGNVISDAAIGQVVMLARRALRDDGQQVIKTIRGRGFRFVAEVRLAAPGPPVAAAVRPLRARSEPRSRLFGRERELDQLLEWLERARTGQGRLALIEGEPGIGKTSLAEELAAAALARGVDVLWGRAWEEGGAPPFWPWIQVLRGLADRDGMEQVRTWAADARQLAQLLPELLTGIESGSSQTDRAEADGPSARFRQFDELARLLRRACGRTGGGPPREQNHEASESGRARLIILEDLHAVDQASVQLVRFLLPELADMRLLVVATFRSLEVGSSSALAALLEVQTEAITRLGLRGLAESDVSIMLETKLGRAAPPRLTRPLHALSAGNPLLLAELCKQLEEQDPEEWTDLSRLAAHSVPERISGAVRKHLAGLPEAARDALAKCSVLGREFSLPLAAALCGCRESELLGTLAPALVLGVVRPSARAAGQLSFSHALVCNTVYAELTPACRVTLHRCTAELLERSQPHERLPLYDIAHHFLHAAADGCRDKAIAYARRAAAQAETMKAYEAAAGLYERALQLLELEGVTGELAHELLHSAGDAWYRAGEFDRAAASFDRAARAARAENHAERFGTAVLMGSFVQRGAMLHDGVRQQQLREALAMLPEADSSLRAGLLATSALGVRVAALSERKAASQAAVEMARRLADDRALIVTLNVRHAVLWGSASQREVLGLADELLALGEKTGDYECLLAGITWRMLDYAEFGDWDNAQRERARFLAEVERFGSPWHNYVALVSDVVEAMMFADFARTRAASERTLALGLRVREPLSEASHALRMLFTDFHQGVGEAQHSAIGTHRPPSYVPAELHAFWALADAAMGHAESAGVTVSRVLASAAELPDALRLSTLAAMAWVCALLGDSGPAQRLYDLLLPGAGRQLTLQAGVYVGPVEYFLGMLARLMGDREGARRHLERTAIPPSSLFIPYVQYEHALTLLDERPAEAGQLLGAVLNTSAVLGMGMLHARASATLAQLTSGNGTRRITHGQVA